MTGGDDAHRPRCADHSWRRDARVSTLARAALFASLVLAVGCSESTEGDLQSQHARTANGEQHAPSERDSTRALEPPVFALRFLEQAAKDPGRWEARLLERDERGRLQSWGWRTLILGDPDPQLVYPARVFPPDPGVEAIVEVRLRQGDWLGRTIVPSTSGGDVQLVELELIQVAVFGGSVVGLADVPLADVELRLRQETGSSIEPLFDVPLVVWSDAQGGFRFGGVEPGDHHLRLRTEGLADVHLNVTLEGGVSDGYTLRMAAPLETSELPIALLGADDEVLPRALLTLRSLNGQHVWRSVHTSSRDNDRAEIQRAGVGYAILFPDLPMGRYELSVLGLDGLRYEPQSVELGFDQLAQGVALQAKTPSAFHRLSFDVRDGTSDEALPAAGVRFGTTGWWPANGLAIAPDGFVAELPSPFATPAWMVVREGYQPAYGVLATPAQDAEALRETVRLKAGWGCELTFRDGELRLPKALGDSWARSAAVHMARPLAGVRVLADGVSVGTSDAQGVLRIALDERPARLVFEKPDWNEFPAATTGFPDAHDTRLLGRAGATVVWFEQIPEPVDAAPTPAGE